jgi:phospho-N-acetylmuramoyl-pentapeptide-transferase
VILQRLYFKYTKRKFGQGRRIFRMAPLHHHFEMLGWPEPKIVTRFYIVAILLMILSLATFKVR